MKCIPTGIPDVLIFEPSVFGDDRGFFFESFNRRDWQSAMGFEADFVQDNHSRSVKGVLRGLHFQLPPAAQGKLVRCVLGEIYDVAVDIRQDSPTFGKWVGEFLSAENKRQLWIPKGFAHGFQVTSDFAEVLYKTTSYYAPEYERCICWNDPELKIDWPLRQAPLLSTKDAAAGCLRDIAPFGIKE